MYKKGFESYTVNLLMLSKTLSHTLKTQSHCFISISMFCSTAAWNMRKMCHCPYTYGPYLMCPVGLFCLLWWREKNLLSPSAFLIFAAFSQSSDLLSLLILWGLQVNWTQISGWKGRASGAHTKLKPHWSQWCVGLSCVPSKLLLSVSASCVSLFCYPVPFPFLAWPRK